MPPIRSATFTLLLLLAGISASTPRSLAQGLIHRLPADGMGVIYEGTITQENIRPDLPDGKEILTWDRQTTIKSVGSEQAEFDGQMQACRWIEIKVLTGKSGAGGIDPGPVGARVYKVLVPESKVIAETKDSAGVPNELLPIVRGFRRTGESQVVPINAGALRFYPTITLLSSYAEPNVVASADSPQTKAQNMSFTARRIKGTQVMERRESRSTNVGEYWVTSEVPFGLARWEATVTREEKEFAAERDAFRAVSTVKSEMSVKQIFENAESELVTPNSAG